MIRRAETVAEDGFDLNVGIGYNEVRKVLHAMLNTISDALAEGDRWEFRGFGVFNTKTRGASMGRNPYTGGEVPIPERRVVVFRPGTKLKEQVSSLDSTREQ